MNLSLAWLCEACCRAYSARDWFKIVNNDRKELQSQRTNNLLPTRNERQNQFYSNIYIILEFQRTFIWLISIYAVFFILTHTSHQTLFSLVLFFYLTISGAGDREFARAEGEGGQGSAWRAGKDEEGEPRIKGQTFSSAAPENFPESDFEFRLNTEPKAWWRGQYGYCDVVP